MIMSPGIAAMNFYVKEKITLCLRYSTDCDIFVVPVVTVLIKQ